MGFEFPCLLEKISKASGLAADYIPAKLVGHIQTSFGESEVVDSHVTTDSTVYHGLDGMAPVRGC